MIEDYINLPQTQFIINHFWGIIIGFIFLLLISGAIQYYKDERRDDGK